MNPLRALFLSLSRIPPAVMLMVIVGLAVVVTVLVTDQISRQDKEYRTQLAEINARAQEKSKVVFAVKDISEGKTISSDALEERQLERARVPHDAIMSAGLACGRVAKYGISAGQIVSHHDLASIGISLGFESRLKAGMRAVTFAVDANSGVAGFVAPQSRVDIMSMVGSGADTRVAAVLSDVEVIATGQTYQKSANSTGSSPASSVTVAVSAQDTEKLIKAIAASKLYLALRSDKDHTPIATLDVTSLYAKPASLGSGITRLPESKFHIPEPPELAAPSSQRPMHEIETWSGGRKEVVSFVGAAERSK